jgi:hypothetical protein
MQGIYFNEREGNLADKVLLKQRHFSILIVFVDRIVIMYSISIYLRDREKTQPFYLIWKVLPSKDRAGEDNDND